MRDAPMPGDVQRLVPPDAAERWIDLPEGRVRILVGQRESADATPLLLLHGGGTDCAGISWFHVFRAFGHARRVLALDLPGLGGTTVPAVGGPAAMAEVVARVAAACGVDRAVVAGVSMGGDVALNLALRHPALVRALVLVGSGGLAERAGGAVTHRLAWLASRLPDALLLPLARLANRWTPQALRAIVRDPSTLPPEVVEEFVREARRPDAGMGYGRYNQATLARDRLTNDLLPDVHEITVPTLLVHGAHDPIVPLRGSRLAADRMPRARLELLETGHWAQLEAPERFERLLRGFLAEVDAQPA